ncbi:hypothetical protein [Alkalihalobacillus sp. LMS39]|uniref:hypothetical protein n=1 Tax=Alkalihalobacillus sp. LMS39 TaxID=2924032 RepID=UPI001FB4A874|nr:hypothetical protein [Alkalihalobacillus sp. LMS39]UOE95015.1 hypothetical protein MM271_05030 [Alkalihalobacillus sp. LMS39]
MNDWFILLLLFVCGGLAQLISAKVIQNRKKQAYVSVVIWLAITLSCVILWTVR